MHLASPKTIAGSREKAALVKIKPTGKANAEVILLFWMLTAITLGYAYWFVYTRVKRLEFPDLMGGELDHRIKIKYRL